MSKGSKKKQAAKKRTSHELPVTRLFVQDVKCFSGMHDIPLRPLTILVGENSTGKSTLLALYRIAWNIAYGFDSANFNKDPFILGAYEEIANYRRGKAGRAEEFVVGLTVPMQRNSSKPSPQKKTGYFKEHVGTELSIRSHFKPKSGQPNEYKRVYECGHFSLTAEFARDKSAQPRWTVATPKGKSHLNIELPNMHAHIVPQIMLMVYVLHEELAPGSHQVFANLTNRERTGPRDEPLFDEQDTNALVWIVQNIHDNTLLPDWTRPYAMAPIRSKPKRTYDPVADMPDPEGAHVPNALVKALRDDRQVKNDLRAEINRFGAEAGLFQDIAVKKFDKRQSSPFQIKIKIGTTSYNMIDVGYGISQVLPVLVDTVRSRNSTLLIQQPEVHLHPKAQAQLGSFFARMTHEGRRFMIETHSDYLLDRIRMEVRKGEFLAPDDVAILFVDRQNNTSKFHDISLDKQGNLVNAPSGYRAFFEDEMQNLLFG